MDCCCNLAFVEMITQSKYQHTQSGCQNKSNSIIAIPNIIIIGPQFLIFFQCSAVDNMAMSRYVILIHQLSKQIKNLYLDWSR